MRILILFARKALLAFATVALVSGVIFVAAEIIPTDPAMTALGRQSTMEQRDLFMERASLNDPALVRYGSWAADVLKGNFGDSTITGQPITAELLLRTKYTAILAAAALLLGVLLSLLFAVVASQRKNGILDSALSTLSLIFIATPEFVLAVFMIMLFSVTLGWFPVTSSGLVDGGFEGLLLPTLTLAIGVGAYVYRIARVSIRETLAAPYVRSAVLAGFSRTRILWRHVMPNAGVVVVNAVALNAINLIGGVIVFETVFSYPGLGSLLISAISDGDIALIEGIAVIMAAMFVIINLAADSVVVLLNPKLRAER